MTAAAVTSRSHRPAWRTSPTAPRIDPVDGQPRCVHDMLGRQCAICLGLPDVPPELIGYSHVDDTFAPHFERLRFLPSDERFECAACGVVYRAGAFAAYSPRHEGAIGRCCEGAV